MSMDIPPNTCNFERQPFKTSPAATPGIPRLGESQFGRITVVLGANGSGKSRLLRSIADVPAIDLSSTPVVFVEGGRQINLPESQVKQPTFSRHRGKGEDPYSSYRRQKLLSSRLHSLVQVLSRREWESMENHKTALYEWDRTESTAPRPVREGSQLAPLTTAFKDIFPKLTLSLSSGGEWSCAKANLTYPLSEMSDGEKQTFCLLADIVVLSANAATVIVDEPELNLHPSLAMRLWEAIEKALPNARFLYATHSLSFSMRPGVTDVLILDGTAESPIHLTSPFDWSNRDLERFLGAIPAVLTSRRVAVVEGSGAEPFDRPFYQWILGESFSVQSGGNCDEVQKIRAGASLLWTRVGNIKILGIVDSFLMTDTQIKLMQKSGCHVLEYHEAESYFCHPKLLAAYTKLSGRKELDENYFTAKLFELAGGQTIGTALRRTIAYYHQLRPGKPSGEDWPTDYDGALKSVRRWAELESPQGASIVDTYVGRFVDEYKACKAVLDAREVDGVLAIYPGKDMAGKLARIAKAGDVATILSAITENAEASEFPHLAALIDLAKV